MRPVASFKVDAGPRMGMIDPTQLSEWFDAHAAALALYARQWVDTRCAEDVVQDVFVHLMAQRLIPANPRAWLFSAVRNAAISALRSRHRRASREERWAAGAEPWFEARTDDLLDARAVEAALGVLPCEQREVIVLRLWAELTFKDIAGIVGEPTTTVFERYRCGLQAIRQRMEQSCKNRHP